MLQRNTTQCSIVLCKKGRSWNELIDCYTLQIISRWKDWRMNSKFFNEKLFWKHWPIVLLLGSWKDTNGYFVIAERLDFSTVVGAICFQISFFFGESFVMFNSIQNNLQFFFPWLWWNCLEWFSKGRFGRDWELQAINKWFRWVWDRHWRW